MLETVMRRHPLRVRLCAWVLAVLLGISAQPAGAEQAGISLPAGFAMAEVASGLQLPTDMVFLPDGDILVAQKGTGATALIRRVENGQVATAVVLSLPVKTDVDSGIQSIVLDPSFELNHQFYVWYTAGPGALNWDGTPETRLSRFTYDPTSGVANPASELIVLGDIRWATVHNGGGMVFDDAGLLVVATGDANSTAAYDPNVVVDEPQDLGSWNGKVLRIQPTATGYVVPADNPFVGDPAARPEVYALGLRNPFRSARSQRTGAIYVGDVGENVWEEVNVLVSGANFGWPEREGSCPRRQMTPCAAAPAGFVDPLFSYPHPPSGGGSVTGLAIVEGGSFPAAYQDALILADLNSLTLSAGRVTPAGPQVEPFASGAGRIVDMEYRDEGLYLLDINAGRILLIYPTASSNQIPVAQLRVESTLGAAPFQAAFSAAGSADPDGSVLTYRWDFGDGSPVTTTKHTTIGHTYPADGNYTVRLTVVDIRDAESETATAVVTVYSGVLPQIRLENLTDPARAQFHGGDSFRYAVERANGLAGLDGSAPYTWRIDLHHNDHAHPIMTDRVASDGVLAIGTDNHGGAWNIGYRIYLTMLTEAGIRVEVVQELRPQHVTLRLTSEPGGAELLVDQTHQATPYSFTAIVGTRYGLGAPAEMLYDHAIYAFSGWLADPQADRLMTTVVPAQDTTYEARFEYLRPAELLFLPAIHR